MYLLIINLKSLDTDILKGLKENKEIEVLFLVV